MAIISFWKFADIMDHNSHAVKFHGLRGATLNRVIESSQEIGDGQIHLWGRNASDNDLEEDEETIERSQDAGVLYTTRYDDINLSYNEFMDESGAALVLGVCKGIAEPQVEYQGRGNREHIINLSEWEVIGAIRPVYADEDHYEIDDEQVDFYTVEDLLEGNL